MPYFRALAAVATVAVAISILSMQAGAQSERPNQPEQAAQPERAAGTEPPIVQVDQGEDWTHRLRREYYTTDQGSRIMPLAWMRALHTSTGEGFLDDGLARYGYLNDPFATDGLPVGFTASLYKGEPSIGMTCAACHTRQIELLGTAYRIDGGPALADFQSFLHDLDRAVSATLGTDDAFDGFAGRVLGNDASDPQRAELHERLTAWAHRYHTLIERALPDPAWGPGRLDAVSMIFNRLAGLDIGEGEDRLIADNIARADAPTRYPFLWNAARQDYTQWPGFAKNGNDIFGLARNLGEVYGVFAAFHPEKQDGLFKLNRDYIKTNSANFAGLKRLEQIIWELGSPRWPWQVDHELAAQGAAIFARDEASGGCVSCHGIKQGETRLPTLSTWATPRIPVEHVGTDARECDILARRVKTGVMEGAKIPFLSDRLGAEAAAIDVLSTAVIGAIIQQTLRFGSPSTPAMEVASAEGLDGTLAMDGIAADDAEPELPAELEPLRDAFVPPALPAEGVSEMLAVDGAFADRQELSGCTYESRVLEGIWAAAPYLHNGSVPTLEELLKPPAERVAAFDLGPHYDIEAVGLAVDQGGAGHTLQTTDCSDVVSGNSRCGHTYGTDLPADERRALLEYLKTL